MALKELDDLLFPARKKKIMVFENYTLQSRVGTDAAPLLHHLSSRDLKPLPSHRQGPWLSLIDPGQAPQVSALEHTK